MAKARRTVELNINHLGDLSLEKVIETGRVEVRILCLIKELLD